MKWHLFVLFFSVSPSFLCPFPPPFLSEGLSLDKKQHYFSNISPGDW